MFFPCIFHFISFASVQPLACVKWKTFQGWGNYIILWHTYDRSQHPYNASICTGDCINTKGAGPGILIPTWLMLHEWCNHQMISRLQWCLPNCCLAQGKKHWFTYMDLVATAVGGDAAWLECFFLLKKTYSVMQCMMGASMWHTTVAGARSISRRSSWMCADGSGVWLEVTWALNIALFLGNPAPLQVYEYLRYFEKLKIQRDELAGRSLLGRFKRLSLPMPQACNIT